MIGFYIAHARWAPARTESLSALLGQLASQMGNHVLGVTCSDEREHASVWSHHLYENALAGPDDVTHYAFLNDDIDIPPFFVKACEAIIASNPTEPIALHTSAPAARSYFGSLAYGIDPEKPIGITTGHPFIRCYWLTGPAYIFPRLHLSDLYNWILKAPRELIETANEDVMAIHWAFSRRMPFYSTLPALVRHRLDIPSTLGYDQHPLRQSPYDWSQFDEKTLTNPERWNLLHSVPPFVENPWMPVKELERIERWIAMKQRRPA